MKKLTDKEAEAKWGPWCKCGHRKLAHSNYHGGCMGIHKDGVHNCLCMEFRAKRKPTRKP